MTDIVGSYYIIDLSYMLSVIGIMICHYYHASIRVKKHNYLIILLEIMHVIALLYWFNIRHSGLKNIWNTGYMLKNPIFFVFGEALILLIFFVADYNGREQKDSLNNDSIEEAILKLPAGLCFSESDGQIVLENITMQDIWFDYNGRIMTDANEAWEYLSVNIGTDGLLRTTDGTVWDVQRHTISVDDHTYIRTKAEDVTELNHLLSKLNDANELLDRQNEKTRKLLMDIAQINEDEERLDVQRQIHHEIGQCIISAKRYINEGGDENIRESILNMWERTFTGNIYAAEEENMEEKEREICEAAAIGGCNVMFRGERPRDKKMYVLYLDAVREAVTNSIRHGQAENVYVDGKIKESDGTSGLTICITNDGVKPEGPIKEGVGLGKLREKLSRAGIRMEVLWENGTEMRLYF